MLLIQAVAQGFGGADPGSFFSSLNFFKKHADFEPAG
jgi:hypothetical protein